MRGFHDWEVDVGVRGKVKCMDGAWGVGGPLG